MTGLTMSIGGATALIIGAGGSAPRFAMPASGPMRPAGDAAAMMPAARA